MTSLAFAVCIFHYAVIRYNFEAVHYDMHVGSLILELALVSALRLSILQLEFLLCSYCGAVVAQSYFLVKARLFTAVTV